MDLHHLFNPENTTERLFQYAAFGLVAFIAMIAVTVLCLMVRSRLLRRQQLRIMAVRRQTLDALLQRIEADDLEAYHTMTEHDAKNKFDTWYMFVRSLHDPAYFEYYNDVTEHGNILAQSASVLPRAKELLNSYRLDKTTEGKLDAIVALFRLTSSITADAAQRVYDELCIQQAGVLRTANMSIGEHYEQLMRELETSQSQSALLTLAQLIRDTRVASKGKGPYADMNVTSLPYPPGWNDMVARIMVNPTLDLFELDDMPRGGVLHLAARSEAKGDFTGMQVALAYHNAVGRLKSELPDSIVTSLIRAVTQKQLALQSSN